MDDEMDYSLIWDSDAHAYVYQTEVGTKRCPGCHTRLFLSDPDWCELCEIHAVAADLGQSNEHQSTVFN